jgi:hypothetical protein
MRCGFNLKVLRRMAGLMGEQSSSLLFFIFIFIAGAHPGTGLMKMKMKKTRKRRPYPRPTEPRLTAPASPAILLS